MSSEQPGDGGRATGDGRRATDTADYGGLRRQTTIEAEQHFAQPIELRRKWRDFVGTDKPESHCHGDLSLDFGNGAARDGNKSPKLTRAEPAMPFGNVGRDRNRRSSKLRGEADFRRPETLRSRGRSR